MTEAAAILEVRHVRLAEQVTMRPAALGAAEGVEGVFVAIDDPPPVRTVLAVVEGDRRRALEVVWVVEVAEHGETRGFYGRWVEDEALARAANVGTEALEDGTPVVQPVVADDSAGIDVSDAMAMPAPVMIMDDDTGVVDVAGEGEDEREEADEDESYGLVAREPATDGDEAGATENAEADGDDASTSEASEAEASDGSEAEGSESEASEAEAIDTPADPGDAPAKNRKKRGRKRR